jgi:transcriptional regulator with PAS, ATPase and Fis domain
MPLALQSKLLRVLQDQEFEPLGSNRVIRVDVRILAATSRDLAAMAADGRFRRDLFYRLNVLTIPLPPLRERLDDLAMLCEHLLEKTGSKTGSPGRELSPGAMELLRRHAWPGNVRELQNVLERAMMNTDAHTLQVADFKELEVLPRGAEADILPQGCTFAEAVAEAERRILESALKACNGNVVEAARRLGIGRATFYRKTRPGIPRIGK